MVVGFGMSQQILTPPLTEISSGIQMHLILSSFVLLCVVSFRLFSICFSPIRFPLVGPKGVLSSLAVGSS